MFPQQSMTISLFAILLFPIASAKFTNLAQTDDDHELATTPTNGHNNYILAKSSNEVVQTGATCQCNCCHLCAGFKQPMLLAPLSTATNATNNNSIHNPAAELAAGNRTTPGGELQQQTNGATKRRRKSKKKKQKQSKQPAAGGLPGLASSNKTTTLWNATAPTEPVASSTVLPSNQENENNLTELGLITTPTPSTSLQTTPDHQVVSTASASSANDATTTVGLTTHTNESLEASAPVGPSEGFTDDAVRLLCLQSPDWLIKAKLTDARLMAAARKKILKIRAYRPIFGFPLASTTAANNYTLSLGPATSNTSASLFYG